MRSPPHAAETTVTDATAGQASRFRQLRSNLIATLVRLEPGRPSYALGLRMVIIIIIIIPLGIGVAFGEIGPATVNALAALNGGMADSGGANVTRWHAMGVATFLNAVALAAGTLAGNHIGIAVPLMFVVTFACAIANLYGNVSANVGFVVSILFMVGVGLPGDAALSTQRLWLALVGGIWAIVVSLLVWPVRPYAAASEGVADSYRSVAALERAVSERARNNDANDAIDTIEVTASADAARQKIAAARSILALTRSRRRGHSALGSKLLQLLVGAGALVERAEGMVTLDEIGSTVDDAEGIMSSIAQSLDGVVTALVAMSEAIEHPNATLDWGPIDALETQMATLDDMMGSIRRAESYDAVATLRPMVEGQRHLATTTALLASEWRDGADPPTTERSPRLAPKDEVRARDRVREAYRALVSNLTLESAVMRHALRYGATSTVGVTLVMSLHLVKGY